MNAVLRWQLVRGLPDRMGWRLRLIGFAGDLAEWTALDGLYLGRSFDEALDAIIDLNVRRRRLALVPIHLMRGQ